MHGFMVPAERARWRRGSGERVMVCVGEAEPNIPPQKQPSRNTRGEKLLGPVQQQEQELS